MPMRKLYRGVAAGDSLRQKQTPARPWADPGQREHSGAAPENTEDGLSDFGRWVVTQCVKLRAAMQQLLGRGNQDDGDK